MYEELIAFLLGRKEELTDDDLDEFVDLLASALEITEEYDIHKKQSLIANMVSRTDVIDKNERAVIASAIDRILQLEEGEDVDIFENEEEASVPLRSRKFTRGQAKPARAGGGGETAAPDSGDQAAAGPACRQDPHASKLGSSARNGDGGGRGHDKSRAAESSEGQEDLLRSVCSDFRSPEKRQKLPDGQMVKFSELFSTKGGGAGAASQSEGKAGPGSAARSSNGSDEFKFDIGELEENHDEGPEFAFTIDDSMEQ